MRLTTWNCHRGKDVDECLSLIKDLDADLVALQECRRPARDDPSVIWRGSDLDQGAAVINRSADLKWEPLDIPSLHRTVVPAVVQGPTPFLFVGVWTHAEPDYNAVARASMSICVARADGLPVVAAGDFNSSPAVKGQEQRSPQFLNWMRDELGLVSAYHRFLGETPGVETYPTHYWQWKESQPFHLDYCFVPESWSSRISSVKIGRFDEWRTSDHRPLTVDLRDSSAG